MAKKGRSQFQCALVLATALALSLPGSAQALVTAGVSRSPSASYVAAYSDTPGGVTVSVERAGSLIGLLGFVSPRGKVAPRSRRQPPDQRSYLRIRGPLATEVVAMRW